MGFRLSYRTRLLMLAGGAAAAPLAAFIATSGSSLPLSVATSALASAVCVTAVELMLRPLAGVSRALKAWDPAAKAPLDEPKVMLDHIARITDRMQTLEQSAVQELTPTGLPGRERFLGLLARAIADSPPVSVLGVVRFGDYDGLASFDPPAAERALDAFAERLRTSASVERLIGQVDRDCFAIWFAGAKDAAELQALAYVLAQEISEGEVKCPQLALGAALFPQDGAEAGLLLSRAMAAMGKPEVGGTAKPHFFSAECSSAARRRFAVGQEARRALQRGEFSLAYQPVVDLTKARVVGAEALLRWNNPALGSVPPGNFVPILEQSGLMQEIGLWVLNTACRQVSQWRGDPALGELSVAVNLSPVQCRDPNLVSLVTRTIERHGLTPKHIELELTETAAMEDSEGTRRLLVELRALGINVSLDDFGAGYSSLTYLKNLPFSKLKIDREFVTQVDQRADSKAICTALVALARGLDIDILAEGVERREELEILRGLGCGLIQGFYFAKPMSAEDFARTVTRPEWLAKLASPVHRQQAQIEESVRAAG